MPNRASPVVYLSSLALIAGYAIFRDGGVPLLHWNLCLLAVGILGVVYWFAESGSFGPPLERGLTWAVLLFVSYVAFQLVPLPETVLAVISPARAQVTEALARVMHPPSLAPISLTPSVTGTFVLRVAAYILVFLMARALTGHFFGRPWIVAAPILLVASLESIWGLTQHAAGAEFAHGTYVNRNHFAGLLEMALPLAVMWAMGCLFGRGPRTFSSVLAAIESSALLSVAALLFAGIYYSLSRMGFAAALASLFVMAVVAVGTRLPRRQTYAAVACLAVVFLVGFALLPSAGLISEFAKMMPSENFSGENRFAIWSDTLQLIRAYSFFGCGFGTYDVAFLKYQTGVVDLDFAFAHNDFLQLLAELGAVGLVIPAAFIVLVLRRALQAAATGQPRVRFVALGCIGSLTAIILHSVVDFNLYIPANALVFSWIAGIASALPFPAPSGSVHSLVKMPFRTPALLLATVLIFYPAAWVVFLSAFHRDARAESRFCRFGICDTDAVLAAQQSPDSAGVPPPVEEARAFLPRDPASPYRWIDLGEALAKTGQLDAARYCFARALDLGPNIPPILWQATIFYAGLGEMNKALENSSHLLQKSGLYDSLVFDWYTGRGIPFEDILLHGIPPDPRPARAFQHRLVQSGNLPQALRAWDLCLERGFAERDMATDFLAFLMNQRAYELAANAWAGYLGPNRHGYRQSDWIYNGDFEIPTTVPYFDWRIQPHESVDVARDAEIVHSGAHSLRIRFHGRNLDYANIRQSTVLPPGAYRFEAFVRTEDITSDQGAGFRIVDAESFRFLDVRTEQLTGTHGWTRIERQFQVPPETRIVEVQVVRPQSSRMDSQIRGTAWVDSVSLVTADGN